MGILVHPNYQACQYSKSRLDLFLPKISFLFFSSYHQIQSSNLEDFLSKFIFYESRCYKLEELILSVQYLPISLAYQDFLLFKDILLVNFRRSHQPIAFVFFSKLFCLSLFNNGRYMLIIVLLCFNFESFDVHFLNFCI